MRAPLIGSALLLLACGAPQTSDSGVRDSGVRDSGVRDSGLADSGHDSGAPDAGVEDAGFGGGASDAGLDAGAVDAGPDAGFDGGSPDGGPDAGPDAGVSDAGVDGGLGPDGGLMDAGRCAQPSGVGVPFRLRVMASNLTSGNFQSYDPGHGIRIIQGLNPDVVLVQEMNYGVGGADMVGFVAALDAGYVSWRGMGQIPNGVLSRFPIADAGEWDDPQTTNREFTWALIDLPGPRNLWVVSVHLLTSTAAARNNEALALLRQLDGGVPASDFLIIGGDFNTDDSAEPALMTLATRASNGLAAPVDQAGNPNTNASRTKPYDQVLASSCLQSTQVDAGLVFDSRVFSPLTDVPPILASDSAAPSMQHMGVVKDFFIEP